jgi:hypothetical protein
VRLGVSAFSCPACWSLRSPPHTADARGQEAAADQSPIMISSRSRSAVSVWWSSIWQGAQDRARVAAPRLRRLMLCTFVSSDLPT